MAEMMRAHEELRWRLQEQREHQYRQEMQLPAHLTTADGGLSRVSTGLSQCSSPPTVSHPSTLPMPKTLPPLSHPRRERAAAG